MKGFTDIINTPSSQPIPSSHSTTTTTTTTQTCQSVFPFEQLQSLKIEYSYLLQDCIEDMDATHLNSVLDSTSHMIKELMSVKRNDLSLNFNQTIEQHCDCEVGECVESKCECPKGRYGLRCELSYEPEVVYTAEANTLVVVVYGVLINIV